MTWRAINLDNLAYPGWMPVGPSESESCVNGLAHAETPTAGTVEVPQHVRDAYVPAGALDLIRKGMPTSTWEAYRTQLIAFGDWCGTHKRTAAPVTEATMLAYLDHLAGLPLLGSERYEWESERAGGKVRHRPAPSTVWIWYSAVRFIHGIGTPPLPWECGKKLSLAIDGYTNMMLEAGWRPKSAPRAYPDDVRRMVDKTDRGTSTGRRDAAILLVGFHTAARAADLATYRIRDVTFNPRGADLLLTASKTLKPGQTRTTAVFSHVGEGGYNPDYDPVLALREWIEWLGAHKEADPSWALFRPLDQYGTRLRVKSRGPGYRMSSTSVSEVVQKYAKAAGLGENYTMHSLRRGYATWLRELGADPLSIARAYGWTPGGSINVYLEEADRWADNSPGARAVL